MSFYEKLRGTIETIVQIGLGGPNLKANAGVLESRNAADSGFVVHRGADPVANNDFVTLGYFNTNSTSGALRVIRFALRSGALGAGTTSSTTSLTLTQRVFSCDVIITTAYDGGPSIIVGQTGFTSIFQTASDNLPTAINTYSVEQSTIASAALPILATTSFSGAPTVGEGFVEAWFAEPLS